MLFFYKTDLYFDNRNGTSQLWTPTKTEARLLPDVIIIGVGKCGTRALLLFLDSHPHFVVAPNEIHFFSKPELYSLGLSEYIRMLPQRKRDDQILLEKTPGYFFKAEAEKRIHAAIPDVKLILTVRDPVTRMISNYVQIREKCKQLNQSYPVFEVSTIAIIHAYC